MTAALTISLIDVHDTDAYEEYVRAALPTLGSREFEVICDDSDPRQLDGDAATRVVVMRWSSRQTALDWFESKEYQAAARLRRKAGKATILLADGA